MNCHWPPRQCPSRLALRFDARSASIEDYYSAREPQLLRRTVVVVVALARVLVVVESQAEERPFAAERSAGRPFAECQIVEWSKHQEANVQRTNN